MMSHLPVRLWTWSSGGLAASPRRWPSLDAQSLDLPDGVYTTLRTYGGTRIVGLVDHLRRLADSARLIDIRYALDLAWLRDGLRRVLMAAGHPEARLRITVPRTANQTLFGVEPFLPYPEHLYSAGADSTTSCLARVNPLAKTTHFIPSASEARAGLDPRVHELLLVDDSGRILEGSSSNFFAVLDGELRTASAGVLLGVTRSIVLRLAAELMPVHEEAIRLPDLPRCPEAFITSSSREVMPVVRVDDMPVGDGRPGPVTRDLMRRYREHLLELAESP
ncbi:MAG TPA: aminotransferase class IV [Thermoanaerobaculaceae bacterium]|nr:aminotransferase class IV [Thermoanaerobaculaceae bacterium]HPS79977.1 aminotransferase class IV [Thermoanaerobaculaceae bacterium]